jgi:hypothetical protein
MSLTFRYKKIERPDPIPPVFCPVIPVTLKSSRSQLDVLALLDSGADTAAMPRGIAEILKLDLSGEREPVMGIGGEGEAVKSRITIIVEHAHERYSIPAEVKVILDAKDEFPVLLGRKDFFEGFNITFKERDKRVVLKRAR